MKSQSTSTIGFEIDWGDYFALFETIDSQESVLRDEMISYFIPLLECFCSHGWRSIASQVSDGKISSADFANTELGSFLYGVDFNTLRSFLDDENEDYKYLKEVWDKTVSF